MRERMKVLSCFLWMPLPDACLWDQSASSPDADRFAWSLERENKIKNLKADRTTPIRFCSFSRPERSLSVSIDGSSQWSLMHASGSTSVRQGSITFIRHVSYLHFAMIPRQLRRVEKYCKSTQAASRMDLRTAIKHRSPRASAGPEGAIARSS